MKILGFVLAVLMLLGAASVGALGARKSHALTKDLDALTDGMTADQKAELAKQADMPSSGRLKVGSLVGILGALAAFALLVATFAKPAAVRKIAGAAVGLTVVSALAYPSVPTGPMDGMPPRTQAIVALVFLAIGVGGALLATMRRSAA